ncbi:MAG: hypothetical protein RSA74_12535, partial [Chryseobacterium sp.]
DTEKGRAFCIKIDVFKKKMWFAYVDSSMAWYDFDIDLVKKLIAQNKKGEKTPPLEDLKVPELAVASVDLIQENSVDRFEKKNRNNRNRNQNQSQNQNKNSVQKNKPRGERPERIEKTEKPERKERPAQNDRQAGEKPSDRNAGRNPQNRNQNNPRPQKNQQPKTQPDKIEKVEKVENTNNSDQAKVQNPNKKNFKKKYPPKKDNNA